VTRTSASRRRRLALWSILAIASVGLLATAVAFIWGDDILEAFLDPGLPYAVYRPPPAPDYARPQAWYLAPDASDPKDDRPAVFFIHPTTFDGGRNWNGSTADAEAARRVTRVMLPNYAAPFAGVGPVFAPRYRQASLYSSLSLFDDAMEARAFPFGDIKAAFASFLQRIGPDRPFVVVGVEQGGLLAARLLGEVIGGSAGLRHRLVAAYLIETPTPDPRFGVPAFAPACHGAEQAACEVAWVSAGTFDPARVRRILNRSVTWGPSDRLVVMTGPPLCVNPLLGRVGEELAPDRLNRGAANATDLEWGARPGFLARQVSAQCVDGILRVSRPLSNSLRRPWDWAARRRVAPYNPFWADLEADVERRAATWSNDAKRN